jgi:hypothetical protein
MFLRYVSFFTSSLIISLILLYYILAFCVIYPETTIGWFISCIICVVIKFGVAECFGPLSRGLLRLVIKDGKK